MSPECTECGLTPGDFDADELGFDPADLFTADDRGHLYCQGCAQIHPQHRTTTHQLDLSASDAEWLAEMRRPDLGRDPGERLQDWIEHGDATDFDPVQ